MSRQHSSIAERDSSAPALLVAARSALLLLAVLASGCTDRLTTPADESPLSSKASIQALQSDRDGDGIPDAEDPCPTDPTNDDDEDGFCNALEADLDGSGCVGLGDLGRASQALVEQDLLLDVTGDGIVDLADVAVFSGLYYLENQKCLFAQWIPEPGISWQWQLNGALDTSGSIQAIDVDLFETSVATINALHAQGIRVIAYISVGTLETWRPDAALFTPDMVGLPYAGFTDEFWVDVRSPALRPIIEARMALAASKRFDAIEPDNVDHYVNTTGFDISEADQVEHLRFIAQAAHRYGLSVGLKNSVELIPEVIDIYDWALNEECLDFDECELLQPFLDAGKAVLHVEFAATCDALQAKADAICDEPLIQGFSTLIKTTELGGCRAECP